MGRTPCCEKEGLKKGPWTPEEDKTLVDYIQSHGHGSWRSLPKLAGLKRCGKSCRLRWTNYLRPDIKRGPFTPEEQKSIIQLHGIVGNKWSAIAAQLPGRTDNEIKNYWNTHLRKHLLKVGIDPETGTPTASSIAGNTSPSSSAAAAIPCSATRHMAQWESARLEAEARLSRKPSTSSENKTDADFFLRLWNSDVGKAFRGGKARRGSDQVLTEAEEEEEEEDVECKSSVTTNGGGGCGGGGVGERSEDVCEESYQLYLDFEGGDDIAMESLFHGQLVESFDMFGDESQLESDFK